MSTLKADTIQSTSGGAATLTKQDAAKCWGKFSAGFSSINDSLNISSLDDDGTGNGGANFTSSFANNNYSSAQNLVWTTGTGFAVRCWGCDSQATGSFEFSTGYVDSSGTWVYYEDTQPSLQIHGDLA